MNSMFRKAAAVITAIVLTLSAATAAWAEDGGGTAYDCIEFGSYPQREVVSQASDSGIYGKVWASESDYIEDAQLYSTLTGADIEWDDNGDATVDGNKYRRIRKSDATGNKFANDGNTDNYYNWSDSETYHYFKYEPITWRILQVDGGDTLLLADTALDCQMYNSVLNGGITWENSTVRSWLNSEFIATAFSSDEQDKIIETSIANKVHKENTNESSDSSEDQDETETTATITDGDIITDENTTDRVFLLSDDEVYSYGFASSSKTEDTARVSRSSTYAKAMGVQSYSSCNCDWWLRSPGSHPGLFIYVRQSGSVYVGGQHANSKSRGVRPALHIKIDRITISAQPESCVIKSTDTASLSVAAQCSTGGEISYAWKYYDSTTGTWADPANFTDSSTGATLELKSGMTGVTRFKCIISADGADSVESNEATVSVRDSDGILTPKNFPNANFLAKLNSIYPCGLTEEQAVEVTSLDVSASEISDLTGIEKFTQLTSLNCSSNKLTALDVSNNTELQSLDCSGNSLCKLNLKNNTELTSVNASPQNIAVECSDTIDMKSVVGEENLSNVTNITGGTYDESNGKLTVGAKFDAVTYDYKTGSPNNAVMTVTASIDWNIECAATLNLGDSIDVYLYITKPDGDDISGYSVKVTYKGTNATKTGADFTLADDGRYRLLLASCNAMEMFENIKIEAYRNGTRFKRLEYSVYQYCNNKIEHSMDKNLKELCSAILDYGTYAKSYFGYTETGAVKNYNWTAREKVASTAVEGSEAVVSGKCTGISSVSASLNLESKTSVNFKFTPADGYSKDDFTVTLDDEAVECENIDSDTRFKYSVKGIRSIDLGKSYTITVTNINDSTSMSITYSPMTYALNKQNAANNDLGNLCKALYLYKEAAVAYFSK